MIKRVILERQFWWQKKRCLEGRSLSKETGQVIGEFPKMCFQGLLKSVIGLKFSMVR